MRACLNHFFLGRVYPGPMTPQNERMVPYVAPQAIMLNGITPVLPVPKHDTPVYTRAQACPRGKIGSRMDLCLPVHCGPDRIATVLTSTPPGESWAGFYCLLTTEQIGLGGSHALVYMSCLLRSAPPYVWGL